MKEFTSIKGVTDQRRLPRLGKIRLGIKKKSSRGSEYPAEVDYFVCPPEVEKVYGKNPKRLDVMLPVLDPVVVFPVAYKAYKASGLFCIGNGVTAKRRDGRDWTPMPCPCPMLDSGECRRTGVLSIVLPKVSIGGVYQIVTGSWNSIVDVLSGIDYVRGLLQGMAAWRPLILERVPNETSYTDDGGKTRKQTHYTLRLHFDGDVDFANKLIAQQRGILPDANYVLPEPDLNPHDDPIDVYDPHDPPKALPGPEAEAPTAGIKDAEFTPPTTEDDAPFGAPDDSAESAASSGQPAAAPAKPKKKSTKRKRKSTTKDDAAPASEPAPAPVATLDSIDGVWGMVQKAFAESATPFWTFLVRDYFQAESSSAVPVTDEVTAIVAQIRSVASMSGEARDDAARELWATLQVDVEARGDGDAA